MVIDTGDSGIAGTPGDVVQQALKMIRPHGAEHVLGSVCQYMVPR
jgi:hypothetical protein